jgi:hypothetical protein
MKIIFFVNLNENLEENFLEKIALGGRVVLSSQILSNARNLVIVGKKIELLGQRIKNTGRVYVVSLPLMKKPYMLSPSLAVFIKVLKVVVFSGRL